MNVVINTCNMMPIETAICCVNYENYVNKWMMEGGVEIFEKIKKKIFFSTLKVVVEG